MAKKTKKKKSKILMTKTYRFRVEVIIPKWYGKQASYINNVFEWWY